MPQTTSSSKTTCRYRAGISGCSIQMAPGVLKKSELQYFDHKRPAGRASYAPGKYHDRPGARYQFCVQATGTCPAGIVYFFAIAATIIADGARLAFSTASIRATGTTGTTISTECSYPFFTLSAGRAAVAALFANSTGTTNRRDERLAEREHCWERERATTLQYNYGTNLAE